MPLREINRIEAMDEMYINYKMKNDYDLGPGDTLIFEVKRHFDQDKNLKQVINKTFEVTITNPRWINFARDAPELYEKYEVRYQDFLEEVYTHLKRGREKVEIYPGELKEYLDFNPDVEE